MELMHIRDVLQDCQATHGIRGSSPVHQSCSILVDVPFALRDRHFFHAHVFAWGIRIEQSVYQLWWCDLSLRRRCDPQMADVFVPYI